ncbi:MAG: hypothetical protein M0P70_08550 [Desulfobulbaceae bacterium]|nr:hypothetical protein [Desulfobulbaceae bacterium]
MISEEIKKKMLKLVHRGATIRLKDVNLEFIVGAAVWVKNEFYWCQWFPEDQHHFHVLNIEFVKMHHELSFEFVSDTGSGFLSEFEPFDQYYEYWPKWVEVRDKYMQHFPDSTL